MKIAIVYFGIFLPDIGMPPATRRIRDIGRGLALQGHEIHILVPRRTNSEFKQKYDGLTVSFLGKNGYGKIVTRLTYWIQLLKLINSQEIKWVIFYNVHADSFLPARILQKKGVKIAAEFCDKHSPNIGWKNYKKWGLWIALKTRELIIPKATNLNICISTFLAHETKQLAPRTPNILLPALVDSDFFKTSKAKSDYANSKWNIPEDSVVVAYAGGLWKSHGVSYILDAFTETIKQYPRAFLIIAGNLVKANTHDDVKEIILQNKVSNNVIATGWVSNKDMLSIYSRADVLIIAQLNTEGGQAGLPTKIAEYAQAGKAIISTNISDIGMYFRHEESIFLIESKNTTHIKEAIAKLIIDPSFRKRLGDNAAAVASQHFDYRNAGKLLSDKMLLLRD